MKRLNNLLNKKQLSKITRQRGFYVWPDEEILLRFQQGNGLAGPKGKGNIQNSNKQQEKSVNESKVQFSNTCTFGKSTDILSCARGNIENSRTCIMENRKETKLRNTLYVSTLIKYSLCINNLLHTNWAHLFYKYFKLDNTNIIDCNVNISRLFSLLVDSYVNNKLN